MCTIAMTSISPCVRWTRCGCSHCCDEWMQNKSFRKKNERKKETRDSKFLMRGVGVTISLHSCQKQNQKKVPRTCSPSIRWKDDLQQHVRTPEKAVLARDPDKPSNEQLPTCPKPLWQLIQQHGGWNDPQMSRHRIKHQFDIWKNKKRPRVETGADTPPIKVSAPSPVLVNSILPLDHCDYCDEFFGNLTRFLHL